MRPITLLNVDYKLFTKVLGDCVKVVLPDIINTDQNGFIKCRFLGNNILDLYALIAIAKERQDEEDMILLSLDIEKAFDSVYWDHLATVLWGFGFPQEFIDWVALTQQNAHIQISNNGWLSSSITLHKGLPQGCGLSPLLFILAAEGLATVIRCDNRIPGITIDQSTKKIAQVADDTLLSFIGSKLVINRIKLVLDHFLELSGLKLNYDKSSLIALGVKQPAWFEEECVKDFKKLHISEGFDYLGLTHSTCEKKIQENFPLDPNLVNHIMDKQTYRKTSLTGRILQIKQLLASTFVYCFQLLPTPNKSFLEKIDKEILCGPI